MLLRGTGVVVGGGITGAAINDIQRRAEEYGYVEHKLDQALPKERHAAELLRQFPNRRLGNVSETAAAVLGGIIVGSAFRSED